MQLLREGDEAAVVAQGIEAGIDFDGDEIEDAVLAGFRQPFESQVDVAERELDPGELERRDVALGGVGFELLQYLQCLLALAREREGPAERAEVRIELPVDANIPHDYITGERLRLEAYTRIASIDSAHDIDAVRDELLVVQRYVVWSIGITIAVMIAVAFWFGRRLTAPLIRSLL